MSPGQVQRAERMARDVRIMQRLHRYYAARRPYPAFGGKLFPEIFE
jgi:hypothetical protein